MFQLFLQLSSYFSKWQREVRPIICAENFSYRFVLCSVRRFEHAFRTLGLLIDQESGNNCLVMMIMWFFCFTCAGTLKRLPVFSVQTVPCSRGIFVEQMQGHFRLRCLTRCQVPQWQVCIFSFKNPIKVLFIMVFVLITDLFIQQKNFHQLFYLLWESDDY